MTVRSGNVQTRRTPTSATSPMVRTDPLSGDEIESFATNGFLRLGRVLDDRDLEALRAVVDRRREEAAELLEPELWADGDGGVDQPAGRNVSFLFNLWRNEPDYRQVALDARFGRWAAQVLGTTRVRLLEDNALIKPPGTGGALHWHQDYSYWPLAQPNAATVWIALDPVPREAGAVCMVPGSHLLGERLPVVFGTGATYGAERSMPGGRPFEDPVAAGMRVEPMVLDVGEATLHHALTWHASGPNDADHERRAAVFRYVGDGTIWLGERRHEFNYSSAEVGLEIGDPIGGDYFPLVPADDPRTARGSTAQRTEVGS